MRVFTVSQLPPSPVTAQFFFDRLNKSSSYSVSLWAFHPTLNRLLSLFYNISIFKEDPTNQNSLNCGQQKWEKYFLICLVIAKQRHTHFRSCFYLVIYSITIAAFQHYACGYLFTLILRASSVNVFLTKMPILLGWPGCFCNIGWLFYYFLNDLILPVIQNAVYGCVVLIIIYWFSNLSATHKFSKNDLCLCFNSWVKMLNNAESNVDP